MLSRRKFLAGLLASSALSRVPVPVPAEVFYGGTMPTLFATSTAAVEWIVPPGFELEIEAFSEVWSRGSLQLFKGFEFICDSSVSAEVS